MHSCLTLIDYTWIDSEESGTITPRSKRLDNAFRLRRTARSLDAKHSHCSLKEVENDKDLFSNQLSRMRYSFRYHLEKYVENKQTRHNSLLLKTSRKLPIYAKLKRLHKIPGQVWVSVGHCRYLLERNSTSGEIIWSSEAVELLCTPRSLSEICMAQMIKDWPCSLPPRRTSLKNIVSILYAKPQTCTLSSNYAIEDPNLDSNRTHSDSFVSNNENFAHQHHHHHKQVSPPSVHDLPITLLTSLLNEAILQKDCAAITGLVAHWPNDKLIIRSLIPKEEYPLSLNYMTKPTFVLVNPENQLINRNALVKGPSLLDAFILGFLKRQTNCKLKSVDFTGFEDDCRVSIELSRLPILWMKPENRNSETVRRHLMASLNIGIPKTRLEAYFERISTIYAFHESEIGHGEQFETVTIHLDCNMTVDEVALGLSLQSLTPFKFSCNRLLLQRIPEIYFPPYSLIRLFDPLAITQFELEDPTLGSSLAVVLPSAVGWLISLRNLRACSLPSCIPPPPDVIKSSASIATQQSINHQQPIHSAQLLNSMSQITSALNSNVAACRLLNRALVSLRYLQRLGLARCHLTGQLKILLGGLSQPLEYLNLQDCCLSCEDINYLVKHWRPLSGLYEMNLSRNNLSTVPDETLYLLLRNTCFRPKGHLVCLSIAYTCLTTERLISILNLLAGIENEQQTPTINHNRDSNHSEIQNGNDSDHSTEVSSISDKWFNPVCTLRVLCIQSFIPPSKDQLHRILYRIVKLPKLHKLHIFPAFYAFPGENETVQKELRTNQLKESQKYLKQKSRCDIEIL